MAIYSQALTTFSKHQTFYNIPNLIQRYHVFPSFYISTLKGILKTLYNRFKETRSQIVESKVVRGISNKARHLKKKR